MKLKLGDQVRNANNGMAGTVTKVRPGDRYPYDILCSDGIERPGDDQSYKLDFKEIKLKIREGMPGAREQGKIDSVRANFNKSDLNTMLADAKDGRLPRPSEIIRMIEQLLKVVE